MAHNRAEALGLSQDDEADEAAEQADLKEMMRLMQGLSPTARRVVTATSRRAAELDQDGEEEVALVLIDRIASILLGKDRLC